MPRELTNNETIEIGKFYDGLHYRFHNGELQFLDIDWCANAESGVEFWDEVNCHLVAEGYFPLRGDFTEAQFPIPQKAIKTEKFNASKLKFRYNKLKRLFVKMQNTDDFGEVERLVREAGDLVCTK